MEAFMIEFSIWSKNVKKSAVLCVLLVLAILSSQSLAANAAEAQVKFDTPLGRTGENPRVIVLDDVLYVFHRREARIASWKAGQEGMETFAMLPEIPMEASTMAYREMSPANQEKMDETVTHVLAGDGKLWALNQHSGKFGEVNQEGVRYTLALDLSNLNPELRLDEDYKYPGFVNNGALYLFSVMKKDAFFAVYDLATGKRQDVALAHSVDAIFPCETDKALCAINHESVKSSGGYAETVHLLDLSSGSLTPLDIDLPEGAVQNAGVYIKSLFVVEPSGDLYIFTESSGGATTDNRLLKFDSNRQLVANKSLPVSQGGFYYLCQPIDALRVITVDAYGAAVLNLE